MFSDSVMCVCVCVSHHQCPQLSHSHSLAQCLVHGILRREDWVGLLVPSPWDLPSPGSTKSHTFESEFFTMVALEARVHILIAKTFSDCRKIIV